MSDIRIAKLRARLFFLWGVWPEARGGKKESVDFSQFSVFSDGNASRANRVIASLENV